MALGEKRFDGFTDRQHKVVAAIQAHEHERDWRLAGAVARQAERATVEKINQGRVSEHEQIGSMVGIVVLFKLGDGWRNDRDRGQGERIERPGAQPRLPDQFFATLQ